MKNETARRKKDKRASKEWKERNRGVRDLDFDCGLDVGGAGRLRTGLSENDNLGEPMGGVRATYLSVELSAEVSVSLVVPVSTSAAALDCMSCFLVSLA